MKIARSEYLRALGSELRNPFTLAAFAVCAAGFAIHALPGCTPAGRAAGRTAIDVGLALCAAEHPDAETPEELRAICGVAEDVLPILRDLLAAQKRGLAKAGAAKVGSGADAGACEPSPSSLDGGKPRRDGGL